MISGNMSGITLKGYICEPSHSKHNRNDQVLIVNGRVVESEEIEYSVYLAYKDFLMTRQYPAFVLYIEIPLDLIDVNVHPNKMRVKFVDFTPLKKLVYNTVRRAISGPAQFPDFLTPETGRSAPAVKPAGSIIPPDIESGPQDTVQLPVFGQTGSAAYGRGNLPPFAVTGSFRENAPESSITRQAVMEEFEKIKSGADVQTVCGKPTVPEKPDKPIPQVFDAVGQYDTVRIAGKLFNTYLLIQSGDDAYVIDQHAAHERILYDRYLAEIDGGRPAVQTLLVPYTFSVSFEEAEYLEEAAQILSGLGFCIGLFGERTFSLSGVPAVCAGLDLKEFIAGLLSDPHKTFKKSDFLKRKTAQAACKAAVKGKDDLTELEIEALLGQMSASGSVPLCPHGRPTFIKLTKTEIEKWFRRIV